MAKKQYFNSVDPKPDFPKIEDQLIASWKEKKIFEKSIEQNPVDKTWTFLDGPPFITGLPHYGTLLSSIPKDLFPRFWTMKGYRVRRVWGWDCHGLPAENKVENKLGIKRKRDIEEVVGVGKFIQECKNYVKDVSSEWDWYIDHVGRWVDFENAYKTMDTEYMESVMWVFKGMYDKGYIYKGLRISLYCPHCATPISNFEVAMDADNYKDVTEVSNTYKYEIQANTFLLAWSTTPWTKITTTALAINPKFTYVKVKFEDSFYVLAKTTLEKVFADKKYEIVEETLGQNLVGMKYVPHYDFFEKEDGKKCFEIVGGDFVTDDEGTGVVTVAPYGEEDLKIMNEQNIQIVMHVDDEGKFTKNVPNWAGVYYSKANSLINEDLNKRGLLFDEKPITHSVATCWRCHERLIYAPQNAWYVDIQKLKPELIKNNENVNWTPSHFKHGRFLKSMESAPDWCISRSRYWGSPVPVWECECGEKMVFGSIKDLEEASGQKITDLHKPEIDDVKVKCVNCGKQAKRVPEVLDSWIEAGSAAFAERHYPFSNAKLDEFFPPDFIVEYTGQIRAWFYVLHVISTALLKSHAFKNVLVTGVVLGTDGRKMSKNFGNYPDPKEMLQKYGGDALRLYLMGTPVMRAEDVAISEDQYRNEVKNYMLTLWNVYNFFVTYANLDSWSPDNNKGHKSNNILDLWIEARLVETTTKSTQSLENYDTVEYLNNLKDFLNDLSVWYLRRSRDRRDNEFYSTIYHVLCDFTKISAPITPFISESIYTNLTKEESVHLTSWPSSAKASLDKSELDLLDEMKTVREIVEIGHSLRKENNVAVRQPLSKFEITNKEFKTNGLEQILMDELNVKSVIYSKDENRLDLVITPELKEEADTRDLIRKIQAARKEMGTALDDRVKVTATWIPTDSKLLELLKTKTLCDVLEVGEFNVEKV